MSLEEMLLRLGVAALLGAVLGLERQMAGKDAGIRTQMMVSAGAALFTLAGLSIPYVLDFANRGEMIGFMQNNAGFANVIANIVLGVGFLGSGLIVRQGLHARSLTTAATVWFVAGVGILSGLGVLAFAAAATAFAAIVLAVLRRIDPPHD
jgi:putative Mg2+ transporter-C (MgtC) family protein